MLNQRIEKAQLSKVLRSQANFHPFPRYEDRAAWQALPQAVRTYYADLGALYGEQGNPPLRAAQYMEFAREGNRSRYEKVYFDRRLRLTAMTIAECMAGDGRLIDAIIDCVWAICEETTWVIPAHNFYHGPNSGHHALFDVETPFDIDLFAAETASHLAWTYSLLGDRLAQESPTIPQRIVYEIDRRILTPYLTRDNFFWMGLAHPNPVNNWNPWINENVLSAALVIEKDPARRVQLVTKIGRSLQRFLDFYAPDGGCDEGPSYFNVAGGAMLDALELLNAATDGAVSLYDTELIQNMAAYIYAVHIDDEFHVNFADAPPRVRFCASLLQRVSQITGQQTLADYTRYALQAEFAALPYALMKFQPQRLLMNLFAKDEAAKLETPYKALRDHYFPGIQVAIGRQTADTARGLFFAAKGGHNAESHSHNDVGNYLLYADGKPILVDAGVETYSRKTFGPQRYEIWTMQSQYHNTAIVNGCDQLPGREAEARDVRYNVSGDVTNFSLDFAASYPKEAQVQGYHRTCTLDRSTGSFTVADKVTLEAAVQPTVLPLLAAVEPILMPGEVRFPTGKRTVVLTYDANQFTASFASIPLTDAKLLGDWQQSALYRVLLTRTQAQLHDAFTLRYTLEDNA